jgi:hypothetical protein
VKGYAVVQLVHAGRSRVLFPMGVIENFHLLKPSGGNRALGLAQPLAEVPGSLLAVV